MSAADQPYPPAGYGPWWPWLGALAIAVAAALWWWTRRRVRPSRGADHRDSLPAPSVRAGYLVRLDAIAAEYRSGALDERSLHHRLSALVRQFVADSGGPPASSMTPADLDAAGCADVAATVRSWWEPQFGPGVAVAVAAEPALAAARTVLTSWGDGP